MLRRMGALIEVFGNSLVRVHGVRRLAGTRMAVQPDRIEALYLDRVRHHVRRRDPGRWRPLRRHGGATDPYREGGHRPLSQQHVGLGASGLPERQPGTSPSNWRAGRIGCHLRCCSPSISCSGWLLRAGRACSTIATPSASPWSTSWPSSAMTARSRPCPVGCTINGPVGFKPGMVRSTDLRGSLALVLSALRAEGTSVVSDVHMALRGYNNLQRRLAGLGVELEIYLIDRRT